MPGSFETEPLSDLIEGGGLLLLASRPHQPLEELNSGEIIPLFERHGVLLFRGFDLPPDRVSAVTDIYTETYSPDAIRRPRRFGSMVVRNVDPGIDEVGLHSEASFAATWPELLWFYCHVPSTRGAYTTVCDGISLWSRLSTETQRLFLAKPVSYHYLSVVDKKRAGQGKRPWPQQAIGVSGVWDMDEGIADLSVVRFAVQESRGGMLCFANHVFSDFENMTTTMADGSPIEPETVSEIREAAKELTYDVQWQAKDLLMLDNRRFTHGRRAWDARVDPRDIVQIQSSHASFAYGATTRKARGS